MATQMTKSQLIEKISSESELPKKDVKGVLETLASIGYKELKKAGVFLVPGFAAGPQDRPGASGQGGERRCVMFRDGAAHPRGPFVSKSIPLVPATRLRTRLRRVRCSVRRGSKSEGGKLGPRVIRSDQHIWPWIPACAGMSGSCSSGILN